MSQRINTQIDTRKNQGDRIPMRFEIFKSLTGTKSGHVDVYEVLCGDQFFGFLYKTSDMYSLVWRHSSFMFELPYTLIEFQFSDKETWRINDLSPRLPFRKEKRDFFYHSATASVFLNCEESAREFDMLDQRSTTKYTLELIEESNSISKVAFARYDSVIMYQGELYKICFTAERLNQEANEWELVINLPRQIVLNPRSLNWAVDNHESGKLMPRMNFEASSAHLSDILSR